MRVAQHFDGYNFRRYDRPWIAKITDWPIGSKPTLKFGGWIGNDKDGGEAEIDANAGDIIRYGHRDNRGNGTVNAWGIVQADGVILRCTEPEARQHWTQTRRAAHDTTAIEIAPMPPQQQHAMTPLQLPSNTPIPLELPRHAEPDAPAEPVQAAQPPQQQTITPDIREIQPTAAHYIQSRAQMDFALVDEYAQMMQAGIEFDPAEGIVDADGTIYIYNGYHRGEAAEHVNMPLRVRVTPGTRADAEWLAFSANTKHGLRRTHADIERVVKNALQHPNAADMSDRELARHCGTDHKTVGNWRRRLADAAKRKNESGEIPNVPTPDAPLDLDAAQRAQAEAVIAQAQALLAAPQPTQTDIADAERPEYTLTEIQKVVEGYLPTDATNRASVLNNLISKTIAGQAYEREIESLLRSNPTRSCERLNASLRIAYGLIIHTLPAGDEEREPADNSGGAGLDALTVLQVEHDKIATTPADAEAIEANAGEADETPPAPQPVEIEQMRCVSCRELYPAEQVTYRTGLCQACLTHQLNQLATDYHTIRATFRVLERMLNDGLAAEIKREIYEEMYAPTPEPEPQPTAPATDEPHIAEPRERVLYYKAQGLSVRKIADALKAEGITLSKSAVDRIIQENKGAQI